MKKYILVLCILALAQAGVFAWPPPERVVLPDSGLENIYRIDDGVYRSEQPDSDGFTALEAIGVKEVLSLRRYHGDEKPAGKTRLRLHRLKTRASNIDGDDLAAALSVILNRKGTIVFHCWHGSDRTGAVCAVYRVVVHGWTKEDAIDEMVNGGFGFHRQFDRIIDVIQRLDVESMRRRLGITHQRTPARSVIENHPAAK